MARKKRTPSTTDSGTAFELQLAQYYESLGFRVTRNKILLGHQVDLLASKDVPGAGLVNVMIEAKFRSSGAVGINEVSNSVNAAQNLLNAQVISNAVIIASTSFTADAKSAVGTTTNIQLTTLYDLQQQLFNSSASLLRSVQDYAARAISEEYIGLSATSSSKRTVADIAKHLHYNCSKGGQLFVLLGDFGSGKTTILERVFIQCARDRLQNPAAKFPVFLRLRSLRQYPDLWSFISANLRDQQYIAPPKHVFETELREGRLVIFLDGFDEVHAGASLADKGRFIAQLYPLMNSSSPSVLSSRPTYFSSPQELLRVVSAALGRERVTDRTPTDTKTRIALGKIRKAVGLGASRSVSANLFDDIWHIDQLSEEAVLGYLKQQEVALKDATGKSATEIRALLDRVYDLTDLMQRPLLLNMVVATVLSDAIDIDKAELVLGPSTLYESYTELSFERDTGKRGPGALSADARRVVCQYLALAMARNESAELPDAEVRRCIIGSGIDPADASLGRESMAFEGRPAPSEPPSDASIESILTDIRLGSFLSFGQEGALRFGHKSFMEFFVAQFICQSALTNPDALARVGALRLNREVIYFLGSYARDLPKFRDWIRQRVASGARRSVMSREAALRVLFASGELSDISLSSASIADAELRRASANRTQFDNMTLREVVVDSRRCARYLKCRSGVR